jgi:ECF sigma factor
MDPEESITRLIGPARTGDPTAAEWLWRAYFDKLVAVASSSSCRPARGGDY